MQVPDKNASMESLVSTLILSGILPVLTLAASLCTNHPLYYQGCTNLLQTASIMSWRMFLKTTDKALWACVCISYSLRYCFEQTVIAMIDWRIGVLVDTQRGGGEEVGGKWKIRSLLSFLVIHTTNSLYWLCVCVCYFTVWHWCWLQKVTDLTLMCRSDLGVAHY